MDKGSDEMSVMNKQFEVESMQVDGQITWNIIRIGHETRGDYTMATFYDRGAIQLFTEALESKGFQQIDSK